jgi:hypothetical protein
MLLWILPSILDCMHLFLLAPDSSFIVALLWSAAARVFFVAGAWLTSGLTASKRTSTCVSATAAPTPAHTMEPLNNSKGLKRQGAGLLCSNTWRLCHRKMRSRCAVTVFYARCLRRGLLYGDLFLRLTICFVNVRYKLPSLETLRNSSDVRPQSCENSPGT